MKKLFCCICGSNEYCRTTYCDLEDFVANTAPHNAAFFECGNCGHNFIFPALEGTELANAYDGYYTQNSEVLNPNYFMGDHRFAKLKFYYGGFLQKGPIPRLLARIAELLPGIGFMLRRAVRFVPMPTKPGKKLLDIGCGNGQYLLRAKDIGYEVVGLDFDKKTVDVARSFGLDVKFGEIDILDQSGPYDVITLSHVIEHVHSPLSLLKKIHELLADGGYFYLATPNFGSAGLRTFGKFWRGLEFPRHLHLFTTDELKVLLLEIGFSRVEVIYDLPQSIGTLKTSYRIYLRHNYNGPADLARVFAKLLLHGPFAKSSLDVIAIKCWK